MADEIKGKYCLVKWKKQKKKNNVKQNNETNKGTDRQTNRKYKRDKYGICF